MHLVSQSVTTDYSATELARTFKKNGNKVRELLAIPESKKAAKIQRDNLELASDHSGLAAKFLPSIGNVSIPLFIVRKYSQPSESKATLEHGGRWYCDWQQLPSEKRKQIRFKRSQSVEIDFTAMHVGLVYALANKQLDWTIDPYQKGELSKYPRKFVKLALLRLLNSDSLSAFKATVTLSGKADTQKRVKADRLDYQANLIAYGHLAKQGFTQPPEKPPLLDMVIDNTPVGVTGEQFLNDFLTAHSAIAEYIGQADLGIKLQWVDSEVMTTILAKLTALGIPSIPIHDSVIVPQRDQAKTTEIMLESYELVTGFKASIG